MRSIKRQKQWMWFVGYTEELIGRNTVKIYGKPEKHHFTVSATSGYVLPLGIGLNPQYDRYITSYERDFKPKEGTLVFVDVNPVMDKNGELIVDMVYKTDADGEFILDEDGEKILKSVKYSSVPDYMIEKILDSQKGTNARYAIKKV